MLSQHKIYIYIYITHIIQIVGSIHATIKLRHSQVQRYTPRVGPIIDQVRRCFHGYMCIIQNSTETTRFLRDLTPKICDVIYLDSQNHRQRRTSVRGIIIIFLMNSGSFNHAKSISLQLHLNAISQNLQFMRIFHECHNTRFLDGEQEQAKCFRDPSNSKMETLDKTMDAHWGYNKKFIRINFNPNLVSPTSYFPQLMNQRKRITQPLSLTRCIKNCTIFFY